MENPWRNKTLMKRLWVDEELTKKEIAERFDCAPLTVHRWVDKHELPRREVHHGEWDDHDTLHEMYVENRMTTNEIANELGCARTTISRNLEKHGIEIRSLRKEDYARLYTDNPSYEYFLTREGKAPMHRLLAIAEYGFDAVSDMHVHHKNGIKWDNRPSNIELVTPEEHIKIHKHELVSANTHTKKIDEEDCREIQGAYSDGVPLAELARQFDINDMTVSYHAKGECSNGPMP